MQEHPLYQDREIREWRRLLLSKYGATTTAFLAHRRPQLLRANDRTRIAEIVQHGRAGVQLSAEEEPTPALRTKRLRLVPSRTRFSKALAQLLRQRSLAEITVDDVLKDAANSSRYTFYTAFGSGLQGAFCYWAAEQLDALTQEVSALIRTASQQKRSTKETLAGCGAHVLGFMMDMPYGRRAIFPFLAYGIDQVGTRLIRQRARVKAPSKAADKAEELIDEFAQLSADLHRAGVRFLHEIQEFLVRQKRSPVVSCAIAKRIWGKPEDVAWHLALSFWHTISETLAFAGILEAEREYSRYWRLQFELWYKGVSGS